MRTRHICPDRPQLHLVTDGRLPRAQVLAAIEAAVDHGVDWVQVRMHGASAHAVFDLTRGAIMLCRPRGVPVAVNDRVDVALAAGADGVQLGRGSLPVGVVRTVGDALQIGVSVHSVAEAGAAHAAGADWVTFGHVFATGSHPKEPPQGVAALRQVVESMPLPVVAIGGIGTAEVDAVLAAGATGIAVISAILAAPAPAPATAALRQSLDRYKPCHMKGC